MSNPVNGAVHVIGAGFAGAAAACALADSGLKVVLWEARERLGGRAGSFDDRRSGERLDNGPHLLMGCYRRSRALLERLGTGQRLTFQPAMHLPIYVRGRATQVRCPPFPAPWFLVFGLWRLDALSGWERLKLLAAGRRIASPVAVGSTVAQWLDAIGAPKRSIDILWAPLCRAVINLEPAEADASVFVAALRESLVQGPQEAVLGWAQDGLGALLGPELPAYLAAHGGELRHARVTAVRVERGKVLGLSTSNGEVSAERVVVATEPGQVSRLLAKVAGLDGLTRQIADLGAAPVISVYLWFDRQVIAMAATPFVGLVGGVVEWVFDLDRVAGKTPTRGQRLGGVVSAGDELVGWDEVRIVDRAIADIAAHFPAIKQATLTGYRVVKERRATVRLTPDAVRPAAGPVAGVWGLYLCGDYTDTGLPATIEGAVCSGEAVARAVLGAKYP